MSRLRIEACRVECPLRGSVDIDYCYACPRFRSIARTEEGSAVRCNAPASRSFNARQTFVGGFVVSS
jgi:hypothetical protein